MLHLEREDHLSSPHLVRVTLLDLQLGRFKNSRRQQRRDRWVHRIPPRVQGWIRPRFSSNLAHLEAVQLGVVERHDATNAHA